MALGAATAGEPAVAAAQASGREVMVASFDLSASFLESIVAGDAAFAVDQQQFLQGYLPVVFLAANAEARPYARRRRALGPEPLTQDKAGQVIELSAQGIR